MVFLHRQFTQTQNYGQTRVIEPPWGPQPVPLLRKQVLQWRAPADQEPRAYTLLLGLRLPDLSANPALRHIWRWSLDFGIGGTRESFLIDALPAQQIAVPVGDGSVSLTVEAARANDNAIYDPPDYDVTAFAYFGRYPVSSFPARYTQGFAILAAGSATVDPLPVGANAWRLSGRNVVAGVNDFLASTIVSMTGAAGVLFSTWTGDNLQALHNSEGFIPLPGGTKSLTISNTGGGIIQPIIEWAVDF